MKWRNVLEGDMDRRGMCYFRQDGPPEQWKHDSSFTGVLHTLLPLLGTFLPATSGPFGFKVNTLLLFRYGEANRLGRQLLLKRDFDAHSSQEEEAQGKQWVGQGVEGARGKHGQEPLLWLLWERQDKAG